MTEISASVVRLETSYWFDGKSMYQKKKITFLKRRSSKYNWVLEDAYSFGAEDVITHIVNLNTVDDGVYEIVPVNIKEHEDVEDCDYKLVEYDVFQTGYSQNAIQKTNTRKLDTGTGRRKR